MFWIIPVDLHCHSRTAKAIGNIKRSVQSGLEIPLEYHLALERELQSDLFQSKDAKEGIKAYVETKTPRFEGN